MDTFGKRLKTTREALTNPIRSIDLAKILDVSPSTVSMWENDKRLPDKPTIKKVADVLGVEYQWLLTGEGHKVAEQPAEYIANPPLDMNRRLVPRLWRGILAANTESEDCTFEQDGMVELPFLVDFGDPLRYEAVRIAGSSMAPEIESGDVCVIEIEPTPLPNTIVLARSPEGTVMLKALREIAPGKRSLESINPIGLRFDDLSGWVLLGRAVAIIHYNRARIVIEYDGGRPLRA